MTKESFFKRDYGKSRNVQLFVDQEEKINKLKEKTGREINISELLRTGLDKVLNDLEAEAM
jgi:hypothetical protein